MLELGRAPAWPRQPVIIPFRRTRHGLLCAHVKILLVGHMQLEPLGRLAAVTGRPAAAIDLAQQILRRGHVVLDLDVLEHLVGEAQLLCEQVHDFVVVLRLEDRLHDLLTPLDGAVRRGA